MPIFIFECQVCKGKMEVVQRYGGVPFCCGKPMVMQPTAPALVRIKNGGGNSARRKWARDWTPESPKFHTGSLHGEKY